MSTRAIEGQSCPDATKLRQFLDDELSAADAVPLQQHIDACSACQQALQGLIGRLPGP